MKLRKARRVYSTKLTELTCRKIKRKDYPFEFMNKLTNAEEKKYLAEVKEQLKFEGITPKNIHQYNFAFKSMMQEREEVYQLFKETDAHYFFGKNAK